MSDDTPLQRAHALSAHASNLLQSTSCTLQVLQTALKAYKDAADLFERSASEIADDDSDKRTLQLLTTRNRKLARDVERRITAARSERAADTPTPTRLETMRRNTSPIPQRESAGLGLGAIARQAWPPPGIATRLSPSRGVPPFAMRPPASEASSSTRPPASRTSTSTTSQYLDPILSPLHSSSSSSGTEIGESYINFGAAPDTLDPFSRFWGMLDNMLDDISNPVAFATAPLGAVTRSAQEVLDTAKRKTRPKSERQASKGKERGVDSESFYLVNKGAGSSSHQDAETPRNRSPTGKTPEELALENENLRASLDALAVHSHAVETENKALRTDLEERTKAMKTAINEVRREAQKAKQGQDLFRSQMMASIPSPSPRVSGRMEASRLPSMPGNTELVLGQKKRIEELEREVQSLRAECDKQRESATKYKERIDKIKANAKSKKEAKAKAEEQDR